MGFLLGLLVVVGLLVVGYCLMQALAGPPEPQLNADARAEISAVIPDFGDPQKYEPMWSTNQSDAMNGLQEQQVIALVVADRTARGLPSYL